MINIERSDNKRFMEIIVDGEIWKKIDKYLYFNHLEKISSCLNKKELIDLFSVLEPQIAIGYVYKLLSIRGYWSREIRKKLKDKAFDDTTIEAVVQRCQKAGYINDEREAQGLIRKEKRRGRGPQAIGRQLKEKSGTYIEFSFSEEEEREQIRHLLKKKFPNSHEKKEKERAYRFLHRRGFSIHLIHEVIFGYDSLDE